MTTPPHTVENSAGLCPRCRRPMVICPIPDGTMRWCGQCYGVWLDNRACQALVGDTFSEQGRDKLHWVCQQSKPARPTPAGRGYRHAARVDAADETIACPVCHDALTSVVTDASLHGARVALDVCLAHGTWFDRGESWALLQTLALKCAELGTELASDARERAREERNAASGTAACPRCGEPLAICPIPDGAMRWCGQCYGVWLDNRACQALLAGTFSEQGRSKIEWVAQQGGPPTTTPVGRGRGQCLVCHETLTWVVTDLSRHGARVALDVCPAHGTWFDHGEACALLQALSLR